MVINMYCRCLLNASYTAFSELRTPRPYRCPENDCGQTFISQNWLARHMKFKHNGKQAILVYLSTYSHILTNILIYSKFQWHYLFCGTFHKCIMYIKCKYFTIHSFCQYIYNMLFCRLVKITISLLQFWFKPHWCKFLQADLLSFLALNKKVFSTFLRIILHSIIVIFIYFT